MPGMPIIRKTKKPREDELTSTAQSGRYRLKKPSSSPMAGVYRTSNVVRHPPPRLSELPAATLPPKNTRSLSVPSLHATDLKTTKDSPLLSPTHKPRSKSVRLNAAKKTSSFKRWMRIFNSHSELIDDGRILVDETQAEGTYRSLATRPRSIGGSSDCSNSSYTHSEFSRNNSLRDSSRSKHSHNDSVFGLRQASYDSADYNYPPLINHAMTGSADGNLRPYSIAYMPRSNSHSELKTIGLSTKGGDIRHHSIAAVPAHSTDIDDRGPHRRLHNRIGEVLQRVKTIRDDTESLWEDSQSFTFVNTPVQPSDPEYRQVAEELMSVSPTRKGSNEFQMDPQKISDITVDPRRVSNDSGVESSSTKPNRSLPTTPIAQSFNSVTHASPERSETPRDSLSQDSTHSLPPGWDMVVTPLGLRYYLDHNSQTSHWKLPNSSDDISLPLPQGWEVVKSARYGTYYVNHNNKTAIYHHPYHSRPPPPYHRPPRFEEEEANLRDRKAPARSHSHRSTQAHRVLDPNASLPRRSKSFRDQETQEGHPGGVSHERQLSTMTYVPPSPYQIAEIPQWLKEYVEAPFGSEVDREIQWHLHSHTREDLNGLDTMVKRLLKKGSEQIVKQNEYYRVAIQQEIDDRLRRRAMERALQQRHQTQYPQYPQYYDPGLGMHASPSPYGFQEPDPMGRTRQHSDSDLQGLEGLEETFV